MKRDTRKRNRSSGLGGLNIFSVISVNQHLASVLPGLGDFPADRVRETDAIGLELASQLAGPAPIIGTGFRIQFGMVQFSNPSRPCRQDQPDPVFLSHATPSPILLWCAL